MVLKSKKVRRARQVALRKKRVKSKLRGKRPKKKKVW